MKKTKIPPAEIGFYQKNRFSESNPFLLYKKKKPMFPASLNIFHRVRVKEKFFLWKFFSGKGNARTVFLRSIEKINFGKPIPSGIDGKRCDIIRFVHSASFPPVLYHNFFNTPPLPADFFPKLCRSRLFFFCFRRNVFTPGFPRLRRQHFFPVAKSVYIVREKREKADYHG